MNIGKYVFSQVIEYIPRYQFDKLVKQYKGDWHSKGLNSYNHLLHLLFGQITGCDSLRDICLCLDAHKNILYHLGIRNSVTHTSLSRANENRDYRIFEGLGKYLIKFIRPMYAKTSIPEITVDNVLYALEVACLYRHRWDIEVFKWIKQNIIVKTLWGYSENAVRIHLWVAIIAYLTFAYIKADHKSPYSITEVATLIRISALEKIFLADLISKPTEDSIQNQNVNDLSLFDNI